MTEQGRLRRKRIEPAPTIEELVRESLPRADFVGTPPQPLFHHSYQVRLKNTEAFPHRVGVISASYFLGFDLGWYYDIQYTDGEASFCEEGEIILEDRKGGRVFV